MATTEFLDHVEGTFTAHIGDIIGIHLGAGAGLNLAGEGIDFYSDVGTFISLVLAPVPASIWLLGLGLAGLAGWRRYGSDDLEIGA